jgi:cell division protein FtsL
VSTGGVKLRAVIAWMAGMLLAVSLPLAHVWKQQAHARVSRDLVKTARDRDALAAEVLLLETETRALRQYSRIESVARRRLGLIDPGPPVVIQPADRPLAVKDGDKDRDGDHGKGRDRIEAARWKGFPR